MKSLKITPLIHPEQSRELDELLRRIHAQYGYDFTNYSRKSIIIRTLDFIERNALKSPMELANRISRDEDLFEEFLSFLLIGVTELFRSPAIYRALCARVFPLLRAHSKNQIWLAGCSSGEEVYSLAILLEEAGLYDRCFLYGTDINPVSLERARQGVLELGSLGEGVRNYFASGGTRSLNDYFLIRYGRAVFAKNLRRNLLFVDHSLICDAAFCEANLVICRNVLFYFNQSMRERAITVIEQSLLPGGFLCVGLRETIYHSKHLPVFEKLTDPPFLFRKRR